MNWIKSPVILEGQSVKLIPLEEKHFEELVNISSERKIWEFLSIPGWEQDELLIALKSALLKKISNEEYPFVIMEKLTGKIIGCTRYMEIYPQFKKLEIGWTWYDPAYWGTGYNNECKYLMLTYAFETLGCVRVQLKTWDKNLRSRAAIQKIGATFEGILRNHVIRYDKQIRNTAMFSIINSEWNDVKLKLEEIIKINNIDLSERLL